MLGLILAVLTIHMEAGYDARDVRLVTQVVVNRGVTELLRPHQFSCWSMSTAYRTRRIGELTVSRVSNILTALMTTQVSPSQGTHYVRKGVRCSWMRGMRVVGRSKYHIIME